MRQQLHATPCIGIAEDKQSGECNTHARLASTNYVHKIKRNRATMQTGEKTATHGTLSLLESSEREVVRPTDRQRQRFCSTSPIFDDDLQIDGYTDGSNYRRD